MPEAFKMWTVLTQPTGTQQVVATSDEWVQVTIRLLTAGPVIIGESQDLQPVTAGKGRPLPLNDDVVFTMPPRSKLWIAAGAVDRVAVTVTSFPWLLQLLLGLGGLVRALVPGSPPPGSEKGGARVNIGPFGFRGDMPKGK